VNETNHHSESSYDDSEHENAIHDDFTAAEGVVIVRDTLELRFIGTHCSNVFVTVEVAG
jgi:hypothetical protein